MAELTEQKQQARVMWALGDYPTQAERIADVGVSCVKAAAVGADDVVLDVACGAGNATIPAAKTGAKTTGLDLTPELLEAGRRAAAEAGAEIEWVEGDAEQLPFDDGAFDVVMSVFGCMFAPDHRRTAQELARVLKPGGRLAVCAWTPEGNIGKLFMTLAPFMPPPPEGFVPPILWGTDDHAREIFDGTGLELEFDRQTVDFAADSIEEFQSEADAQLPPVVAARAMLEPQGRWKELRGKLLDLHEASNISEEGGFRSRAEYLVIKGTKS